MSTERLDEYVKIDFFGQKTDRYYDEHLKDIQMFKYKGVLSPNEVMCYDALIFPSHYEGEGCPGILVEVLSASLPIIASDWKYNGEFITNGYNGFLCDTFNTKDYVEAIKVLLLAPTLKARMAENAHKRSEEFSVNKVKNLIKIFMSIRNHPN